MKGTSWITVLWVIILGSVVGIAGGCFLAWWMPIMKETHTGFGDLISNPFHGKRYVRMLMIGVDNTGGGHIETGGLSDTLVVMALDTETKTIRAISIPRDTKVEIPEHGTRKINSAHAFGGPEQSRQVISDLLGVPIDYYIKTDLNGLVKMVDMVGGVYIVVDKDMHYTDRKGKLFINLKASPEKQLLNGNQAMGFVRFRHDAFGDSGYTSKDGNKVATGRIVRQQYFMRALANRILSMPTKRERAKFMREAYEKKYIVSDLNMKDWEGISEFFKDFDPAKMKMDVLPGGPSRIGGASYWVPDPIKVAEIVATNMNFAAVPEKITANVEVLNGSGIAGAATIVAEKLRSAGFVVTRTGNAPNYNYSETQIIKHSSDTKPAERICELLSARNITEELTDKKSVDITVIIGKDYSGVKL